MNKYQLINDILQEGRAEEFSTKVIKDPRSKGGYLVVRSTSDGEEDDIEITKEIKDKVIKVLKKNYKQIYTDIFYAALSHVSDKSINKHRDQFFKEKINDILIVSDKKKYYLLTYIEFKFPFKGRVDIMLDPNGKVIKAY